MTFSKNRLEKYIYFFMAIFLGLIITYCFLFGSNGREFWNLLVNGSDKGYFHVYA